MKTKNNRLLPTIKIIAAAILVISLCFAKLWIENYPAQIDLTEQKFELYMNLHDLSYEDVESYEIFKTYFYAGCTVRVKYINDDHTYHYDFYKDLTVNESTCIPKSCLVYDKEGYPIKSEDYCQLKYPTAYRNSKTS